MGDMLTKSDLLEIKKVVSDVIDEGVNKKIVKSEKDIEDTIRSSRDGLKEELERLEKMIKTLEKKVEHEDESLKKRLKKIEDHI